MIFPTKRRLFVQWLDERQNEHGRPVIDREQGIPRNEVETFFLEKSGLKSTLLRAQPSRWTTEDFARLLDVSVRDGYITQSNPGRYKVTLKGSRFISRFWLFYWLGENFAAVIALLSLVATFAIAFYTAQQASVLKQQIQDSTNQSSAQFVLNLENEINGGEYTALRHYIEDNPYTSSPHKARFTDDELEDYMSEFDTAGDLLRDNIIDYQMAYDEISYDAEKTYCNEDVQSDIQRDRQGVGTSTWTDTVWKIILVQPKK